MLRSLMCGVFILTIAGLVAAEEFTGSITKVDGDKVTVQKFKKPAEKGAKPEKDGDPVVFTAAKDVKVTKAGKKGAAGDPIENGLKNELFSAGKGVFAKITAEGTTISEIAVIGGGKKKKDN